MEKINIAELLRHCPSGMELDCTCADNVVFDKIIEYDQIKCVIGEYRDPFILDKYGRLLHVCCPKCVIFPKGRTTWAGFKPPCSFMDGDIVATTNGRWIGITEGGERYHFIPTYCVIIDGKFEAYFGKKEKWHFDRFATAEEKQKLFQAIKDNGYKWNPKTKTLEKLPKFKVGDRIVKRDSIDNSWIVSSVGSEYYRLQLPKGSESIGVLPVCEQDGYELLPNKFDISTLKPFERVLVRYNKDNKWCGSFFSHIDKEHHSHCYKYVTAAGKSYPYCIPFEGNEHLLGTTNDCSSFFKTWEQ